MSHPKFSVAICGGAISGLSLAAFISKHTNPDAPVKVDVYESRPEISVKGTGIGIWKRSWQVLQELGLHKELEKRNIPPPKDGEVGGPVFRKSDQPEEGFVFHAHIMPYGPILLQRPLLLEMIQAKLNEHCTIHTSKHVERYHDSGTGPVTIYFQDGTTAQADVLVGSDGVHSSVRATLFRNLAAIDPSRAEKYIQCVDPRWSGTYAYRNILSTAKIRERNPDHLALKSLSTIYCGKGKHGLTNSQGEMTSFGLYYTVEGAEGSIYEGPWVKDVPKQEVVDALVGWEPALQQLLEISGGFSRWAINVAHPVPQSVHGKVALLGDAAHAMTPHQGVGGGQAIEDAHMLGRLLAHDSTDLSNVAHALAVYQHLRLPPAQLAAERSRRNGNMYEFNDPDFCFDDEPSRAQLEALGEAVGKSFQWLGYGGYDEDWATAERLLRDGRI